MFKNNYDTNSKGLNIEISISYDSGLSQIYYDESMQSLQNNSRYISDQWYVNYGDFPRLQDIEFKFIDNVKTLKAWIKNNVDEYSYRMFKKPSQWDRQEIIDILNEHFYDEKVDITNFQDIQGLNIGAFYKDKQIDIDYIVSRGYSQGDSCKVYFSRDLMRESWGNVPNDNDLRTMFDNILWDSPISGHALINEQEYYYELDQYDFEREKWIEQIVKDCPFNNKELLRQELERLIPETLDYN